MTKNTLDGLHAEFCEYALYERNLSPATIRWYKECFKEFKCFIQEKEFQKASLENLNVQYIRKFLFDIKKRGCKPNTHLSRYKGIKSFCTYLVKEEALELNPYDKIEKPKVPKTTRTYLDELECRQLLQAVSSLEYQPHWRQKRDKVIIGLFLYGGLRKSDLINLKTEDILFNEDYIHIKEGKGGKDRVIPLHHILKKWILDYIKEKKNRNLRDDYLIIAHNKNAPVTHKGLQMVFESVKKLTSIKKHFSPHTLRHSFATMVLNNGMDIESVKTVLGHEKITTTAIYLHSSPKQVKESLLKHHPLG